MQYNNLYKFNLTISTNGHIGIRTYLSDFNENSFDNPNGFVIIQNHAKGKKYDGNIYNGSRKHDWNVIKLFTIFKD